MSTTALQPATDVATTRTVFWILRIGVVWCFIGHGALGIQNVAAWTAYFGVVGIGPAHALSLMPWVGLFDVVLAMAVLFYPARGLVAYMVLWTLWTALLRPLAGESFWEAIERAGNYGAPLALLILCAQGRAAKSWFDRQCFGSLDELQTRMVNWVLRLTTALLLLGHGALNGLVQKPMFHAQYSLIGLSGDMTVPVVGLFECLLAFAVLLKPNRWLLLGVVGWKLATETLVPLAGAPVWVFIEHGGSYAAPLALVFLLPESRTARAVPEASPAR